MARAWRRLNGARPLALESSASFGGKMQIRSAAAILCGFSCPLVAAPAIAKPVTVADLSGKKFCWNDGGTEKYSSDGKYSSTHDGEGTWVLTDKGVSISTNQIVGVADMQKLDDGSFSATWIVDGKPKTWTGRYCE